MRTQKIGRNSCNGIDACLDAGSSSGGGQGAAQIGNDSCNPDGACKEAGFDTNSEATIGNNSCNGETACRNAGGKEGGFARIGRNACNDGYACYDAGYDAGEAAIGNGYCVGNDACRSVGRRDSLATIANKSCNGPNTGENAGSYNITPGPPLATQRLAHGRATAPMPAAGLDMAGKAPSDSFPVTTSKPVNKSLRP